MIPAFQKKEKIDGWQKYGGKNTFIFCEQLDNLRFFWYDKNYINNPPRKYILIHHSELACLIVAF
jgi:hypothetical protein